MTDTNPNAPITPPGRPWAKIILVLSLGLNLLFLGLIGGAILRDGPQGRPMMVREVDFGSLTEALDRDDRETLRRSFQRAAPELRGQRRDVQSDLAELMAMLRAPEFQRDRVEALFARHSERASRRQELGQQLMLDLLVAMPPDDRAAFADRLENALKRSRRPAN